MERTVTLPAKAWSLFARGFLIAVVTVFVGLILPGLTAYKEGMFDVDSMTEKVKYRLPPEIRSKIEEYLKLKADAERKLVEIDTAFLAPGQLRPETI
jgi:hypothetical protein